MTEVMRRVRPILKTKNASAAVVIMKMIAKDPPHCWGGETLITLLKKSRLAARPNRLGLYACRPSKVKTYLDAMARNTGISGIQRPCEKFINIERLKPVIAALRGNSGGSPRLKMACIKASRAQAVPTITSTCSGVRLKSKKKI